MYRHLINYLRSDPAVQSCTLNHRYMLQKVASALENMCWVSVEDRLPPEDEPVLCWYEYYHWSKKKVLPEYEIGYYTRYGTWGGEVGYGKDAKVLFWMPLPTPPQRQMKEGL